MRQPDDPPVHPRIHERHPQIDEEDVPEAWRSALVPAPRTDGSGSRTTVGPDGRGRLPGMVSIHNRTGRWLIYHAMTPPSRKTMNEPKGHEEATMNREETDRPFAVSDQQLDRMAHDYETGDWKGGIGPITPGRPRIYHEELETVSFRLPKSRLEAIDADARARGESRSQFLRRAIDQALPNQ